MDREREGGMDRERERNVGRVSERLYMHTDNVRCKDLLFPLRVENMQFVQPY